MLNTAVENRVAPKLGTMERQRHGGESWQGDQMPGHGDAQGGWGTEAAVTEGVETPQHTGRTWTPPGLSAPRGESCHLDQSADAVPLAMQSLPGAIFLAHMHSEQRPFPEEKRPDVTADAFSFYF